MLMLNILACCGLVMALLSSAIDPRDYRLSVVHSLSFPYVYLLNLLFFGFWLAKLRWPLFLSLLCLVIGYSDLTSVLRFARPKPTLIEGPTYRLMNYNVRMFNRFKWIDRPGVGEDIKTLIEGYAPDILCIQEYHDNKNTPRLGYRTSHLLERSDGKTGELAIFSRFPEVHRGRLTLSGPEADELRTLIYSDLAIDQDTVRVVNVHLASLALGSKQREWMEGNTSEDENPETVKRGLVYAIGRLMRSAQVRAGEVEVLSAFLADSPHPILLCGDLNDVPVSFAFETIKEAGLSDAFEQVGKGFGETFAGSPTPLRIDAVFGHPEIRFDRYSVVRAKLSDHYPMVVDFGMVPKSLPDSEHPPVRSEPDAGRAD